MSSAETPPLSPLRNGKCGWALARNNIHPTPSSHKSYLLLVQHLRP